MLKNNLPRRRGRSILQKAPLSYISYSSSSAIVVVVTIASMMMTRGRYLCCSAWMPTDTPTITTRTFSFPSRICRSKNAAFAALRLPRGGSDDCHNLSLMKQPSHSITTTSTSRYSTAMNPEYTTVLEQALSLCDDSHTIQAAANFGGLQYWNTVTDDRFRVVFVLGGPGAGKGTQSELLVEHYPVVHFSVGELLRNVPVDSPHKTLVEQKLVAGQIVPVEISLALLKAAMHEARARVGKQVLFLVDGFPRNYDNLTGWCNVMKDAAALEAVLVYQCPLAVLQVRILERAKMSGRSDDNLESVRKRFATFVDQTMPVVEILRSTAAKCNVQRWNVFDIAGDRPVNDVWLSTQQILNNLILHDVLTANAALLDSVKTGNTDAYQSLCDEDFFNGKNAQQVMHEQEGNGVDIQFAQMDVISGKNVAVSYNRLIDGIWVFEKRFWIHHASIGWRNVHFQRTPVS